MHHDDVVGRDWPDVHGSSGCPGASLDGERVGQVEDGVDDDVGQDEGDQDGEADGSCQADVEVGQRLVPGAFDGHEEADGRDEKGEESAEVRGQDVRQEVDAANDSPELLDVDEAPDIAEKFGVMSMPTFIFVKDGEVVDRFSGASVEKLTQTLMAYI